MKMGLVEMEVSDQGNLAPEISDETTRVQENQGLKVEAG